MKILHTSDLHLGRSFHGRSLVEDQHRIHRELVALCREEGIGAVLVSGDVYDQASPRTEIVQQFSDLLGRLHADGVQVVLTSGNHDSAGRLGFGASMLEQTGIHLRTRVEDIRRPVYLGDGTLVYGIPYLDPRSAASRLGCEPTHRAVLEAALALVREDMAEKEARTSIVMAHCFAVGASASDSERIIDSGHLGAVPASVFEGFDYAALGHLHGRQTIRENVRYSGSPLAFSFSEAAHTKGYWLLETGGEGLAVTSGDWHHGLRLARLSGPLDELLEAPEHAWAEDALCQITLTDAERPAHPMERLRTRFPETLELNFSGLERRAERSYAERIARAKTPVEACASFYERVRGRSLDEAEHGIVSEAVARAHVRENQENEDHAA